MIGIKYYVASTACVGIPWRKWWGNIWHFPGEDLGQHPWNLPATTGRSKRNSNWLCSFGNTWCKSVLCI